MDLKPYLHTYRQLYKRFGPDVDICMSESFEKLLEDAGAGMYGDNRSALVRMQLAAEEFKLSAAQIENGMECQGTIYEKQQSFITYMLKRKLRRYSVAERRTAMIEMTEIALELLGDTPDDLSHLQMLQRPVEEIEQELVDCISELSFSLMPDGKEISFEENDEIYIDNGCFSFSPEVGSCTAYLCDSEMRKFPESIGFISEATSSIVDSLEEAEDEEISSTVGMKLLLLSVCLTIMFLEIFALGTGFTVFASLYSGEALLSYALLAESAKSYFGVCAMGVMASMGIGAAGITAEALSWVKRVWNKQDSLYPQIDADNNNEDDDFEITDMDDVEDDDDDL